MASPFEIGYTIWTTLKPWKRLKTFRNKRRAKKGLPPLSETKESDPMNGYKTYAGIAILVLTPLLAKYGVSEGDLSMWVTAVGTVVGGLVAVYGRMRAGK